MTDYRNKLWDILKDPDQLKNCTKEELLDLQKKSNPYGNIIPADESYINISLTNMRDEYWRKIHFTALVGYQYRVLEEYKPYDEDSPEYEKAKSELLESGYTDSEAKEKLDKEFDEKNKAEYEIIRRFLDRNFEFNPDRHLRPATSENKDDPERLPIREAALNNMRNASAAHSVRKTISEGKEIAAKAIHERLLSVYSMAIEGADATGKIIEKLMELNNPLFDDYVGMFSRFENRLMDVVEFLAPMAIPLASDDIRGIYEVTPSIDVFFHLERYLVNHYEQIREACQHLYNCKPDLEYAINYYEEFQTKEEADDHQRKYENSVISSIFTIKNEGWTLLGPFKQNRDRINFYNKNTEVIRRIFEQMEEDHKLGGELMKNRVRREKIKNIKKAGLDAEGMKQYRTAMGTIEALGAKKVLTDEEKEKLFKAQRVKEQLVECPDNAVQVDTFYTDSADGKLKRTKWWTKAEAPDNPADVQARIAREQNELRQKMLMDRHGNKRSISEVKRELASKKQ